MDQECKFCSILHLNANLRSCPYNDTLQIQIQNWADKPEKRENIIDSENIRVHGLCLHWNIYI